MINLIPGIQVERSLPVEILTGLITGAYKSYGGVIRWAPGTEFAGQIVRHLIPVAASAIPFAGAAPMAAAAAPFLATAAVAYGGYKITANMASVLATANENSQKIDQLSSITKQILQLSNGLMFTSGLNLAVSAIGFAVLNSRLNSFESKLNAIQNDVKEIKALLALNEKSKLAAVLRDLINIESVKNIEHRDSILLNSKNVLAPISLKYKELLSNSGTIEAAMAYEEYYSLTSIAHSRCLAELGMLEMAKKDLEEVSAFWNTEARRITNDLLLKNKPERFLHSDFSKKIPASTLAEWCDFAYEEDKGYGWIDELRNKIDPWYTGERGLEIPNPFIKPVSPKKKVDKQFEVVVPSIQKLVARHNVLNGFVGEYELLEKNKLTPSSFQKDIVSMDEKFLIDGYLILNPN
jgi:hypothetical protein